jgi:hypothetical protein
MVKHIQLDNMRIVYETETIKVVQNEDGKFEVIKK